jgi:hypothetical protein
VDSLVHDGVWEQKGDAPFSRIIFWILFVEFNLPLAAPWFLNSSHGGYLTWGAWEALKNGSAKGGRFEQFGVCLALDATVKRNILTTPGISLMGGLRRNIILIVMKMTLTLMSRIATKATETQTRIQTTTVMITGEVSPCASMLSSGLVRFFT